MELLVRMLGMGRMAAAPSEQPSGAAPSGNGAGGADDGANGKA
jgi:hypothetical protein